MSSSCCSVTGRCEDSRNKIVATSDYLRLRPYDNIHFPRDRNINGFFENNNMRILSKPSDNVSVSEMCPNRGARLYVF